MMFRPAVPKAPNDCRANADVSNQAFTERLLLGSKGLRNKLGLQLVIKGPLTPHGSVKSLTVRGTPLERVTIGLSDHPPANLSTRPGRLRYFLPTPIGNSNTPLNVNRWRISKDERPRSALSSFASWAIAGSIGEPEPEWYC